MQTNPSIQTPARTTEDRMQWAAAALHAAALKCFGKPAIAQPWQGGASCAPIDLLGGQLGLSPQQTDVLWLLFAIATDPTIVAAFSQTSAGVPKVLILAALPEVTPSDLASLVALSALVATSDKTVMLNRKFTMQVRSRRVTTEHAGVPTTAADNPTGPVMVEAAKLQAKLRVAIQNENYDGFVIGISRIAT